MLRNIKHSRHGKNDDAVTLSMQDDTLYNVSYDNTVPPAVLMRVQCTLLERYIRYNIIVAIKFASGYRQDEPVLHFNHRVERGGGEYKFCGI